MALINVGRHNFMFEVYLYEDALPIIFFSKDVFYSESSFIEIL
jgi:hypothetical protein